MSSDKDKDAISYYKSLEEKILELAGMMTAEKDNVWRFSFNIGQFFIWFFTFLLMLSYLLRSVFENCAYSGWWLCKNDIVVLLVLIIVSYHWRKYTELILHSHRKLIMLLMEEKRLIMEEKINENNNQVH